ncbi:MAG TPA: MFS transporter [Kofleriaceae bacterium]|nr:MFS transporter [Kofleriaceae bacterium]
MSGAGGVSGAGGPSGASNRGRARVVVGFGAFGLFWGSWGALVPAVQTGASTSNAELGNALLMVGLGALASMRLTGGLVDRHGGIVLPIVAALFGVAGLFPGLAASPVALGGALLVVGVTSGAMDVALNAAGVDEEVASGRPLLNLAHAGFSASVVVASLATGALRAAGAGPREILAGVMLLLVGAALGPLRPRRRSPAPHLPTATAVVAATATGAGVIAAASPRRWRMPSTILVALGGLCAVAFVIENAWQTWSAAHLEHTLGAPAGLSAVAPAVFAAAATAGRLGGNVALRRVRGPLLLAGGALVAAVGSAIGALAGAPLVALFGVGLAGLGTSVCAPTLISMAGAWAGPARRAAAVSTVTTIAYLGFLLGPAVVGQVADATSLPTALAAIAGLALVLAALAPFTARVPIADGSPQPGAMH